MLSLLVSHTMYINLHKYFIDLLSSHIIQYSNGFDFRFPHRRSWFDSQLRNTILYFVVWGKTLHINNLGLCIRVHVYNTRFVYCRELAAGIISLAGGWARSTTVNSTGIFFYSFNTA